MKLCLCGCREVRHEDLGKGQRGACLRCGCEAFKDAKSGIEDESGSETSVLPEEVDSDGRGLIEVPPAVNTPPAAGSFSELLESFNAWRCCTCGGRSWHQTACCLGQRMEPVRVEIHAREP